MALDVKEKWDVTPGQADYANRGSHLEITYNGLENSIVEFVDPTVTIKLGSVFELNGFFVRAVSDTELNYVGGVKYIHVLDLGNSTVSVSLEDSSGVWDEQKNGYYETNSIRVLNWRLDTNGAFRRLGHSVTSSGSNLPVVLDDGALKIATPTVATIGEGAELKVDDDTKIVFRRDHNDRISLELWSESEHFSTLRTGNILGQAGFAIDDADSGETVFEYIRDSNGEMKIHRPLQTTRGIFNGSFNGSAILESTIFQRLSSSIPNVGDEMTLQGVFARASYTHAERVSSTAITIFGVDTFSNTLANRTVTTTSTSITPASFSW